MMNIIHSSTLGLFTNSLVKIYWLFIHPVLGLFIYSRLAATGYSRPTVNFAEQRLLQTQTFLPNVRQLVLSVQSATGWWAGEKRGDR